MTRTTNARIAGFTYLFYTAIGICSELLMHQAKGVDGDAAKLERFYLKLQLEHRRGVTLTAP